MNIIAYAGNAELPQETKDRVVATFKQTLKLYTEGKTEDVAVGCDFILKYDPLFQPAMDLLTRVQNPDAPIDLDIYVQEYLQEAPAIDTDDLMITAIEALNEQNFEAALQICHQILQQDPNNNEARDIGTRAQEELEKTTFVQQFTSQAESLISEGKNNEALGVIETGLELDDSNEKLLQMKQRVTTSISIEPESAAPESTPPEKETASPTLEMDAGGIETKPEPAEPGFGSFEFDAGEEAEQVSAPSSEAPEMETSPPSEAAEMETAPPVEVQSPPGMEVAAPTETSPEFAVEEEAPEEITPAETEEETPFQFDEPPAADTSFDLDTPVESDTAKPSDQPATPEPPPATSDAPAEPAVEHEAPAAGPDLSIGSEEEPSDDRIKALLSEGDTACARSEYQEAIDIWSRIYLIDMNSTLANDRIEKAKEAMAEGERELAEIFSQAVQLFDDEKHDDARAMFEKVLAYQPQHMEARTYLQKLDALEKPKSEAPPPKEEVLDEDLLPPPRIVEEAEPPRKKKSPVLFAVIVAVVIIVAAVVVVTQFLPSGDNGSSQQVLTADILIEHAEQLYQLGKVDEALKKLNQVDSSDPLYPRALELIETYRKTPTTPLDPTPQPDNNFDTLVREARKAMNEKKFGSAAALYHKAAELGEIPSRDADSFARASAFADTYKQALAEFNKRRYSQALTILDALEGQYPDQKEARELKAKSHYNQGIGFLKDKDMINAETSFAQVQALYPDDAMAAKNLKLAKLYQEYPTDLLYRIYIKYLTYR